MKIKNILRRLSLSLSKNFSVLNRSIMAFAMCLLCFGCTEVKVEKKKKPSTCPQMEIFDLRFNSKEFDEICRRLAKLDLTVVAPGCGIDASQTRLMRLLISKYRVNIPPDAMGNKGFYYSSDSEENRLKFFEIAVKSQHPIIWAMRGGFGTNFIISDLDKRPIPKVKKTLVGFSDTVSLQLFVTQKWGWKAIHAPVMIHLAEGNFSKCNFDTLLDILEERLDQYTIDKVYPINDIARNSKYVTGKLTGGNLTLIQASIGTCWEIQTHGKILFIEDNYMKPHWIYRSMYHLKESGRLHGVKAIVFGRFVSGGEQKEIGRFLCKFADEVDIPVYITDQFGHGNHNKPLIYNAVATFHDNKMTIKVK